MADCSSLLTTGIATVQQATEMDKAGDYAGALRLYSIALESFVSVMKYERNDKIKNTLRGKISDYMERAEQLKVLVNGGALPTHVSLPPPSSSPSIASPPPVGNLHAQSIKIRQGQTGCSYDTLFGKYLTGATMIFVEDPYIRADHQVSILKSIFNLLRLCETIIKRVGGTDVLVHLMTTSESAEQRQDFEQKIAEMKVSLSAFKLQLVVTYNDAMHDREIRLNNGWIIKIGRGLDFYAKPQSRFSVGVGDLDLRPCLETSVDIFKENSR